MLVLALAAFFAGCDKEKENPTPPEENWPEGDIRVIKTGLNFPWEILWGKDNNIWMTERSGTISKVDPKNGTTLFTFTIPEVVALGEGGLLGMVQHPDFLNNGFFYVVYTYTSAGPYQEKVVRYTYNAANNTAGSPTIIIDGIPAASNHNGSRLLISNESSPKLYITTGDANNIVQVQEPWRLGGKVLRLNLDGSIPADNPDPSRAMWSLGHRNPQGMVMANNILYISDHGSNIEDEINIIEKNRNYGWSNVNGPCDNPTENAFCQANNVKEPIWSTGNLTLAVCGLDYYNADRIPQWKNSLLLTTLKDATLYQMQLSANGQSITRVSPYFRGNWGRLRDVCVSPAGRVYLCTSNGGFSDRLIEISKPE